MITFYRHGFSALCAKWIFGLIVAFFAQTADAQRPGKDYALFFVVTDFDAWPDLAGTDKDPRAIAGELEANYGYQRPDFYLNSNKAEMLRVLTEYQGRNFGPNDQLLIFISTHGYFDDAIGAIIPRDGLLDDPSYQSWILHPALEAMISKIRCPHILLALDACYSGTFGQKYKDKPTAPAWEDENEDCRSRCARVLQYKSRLYLTSGGNVRTPSNSQFARKWLEALRLRNEDGFLTFPKLYSVLSEANPMPLYGDFKGHEVGGNFLLLHKQACATVPVIADADGDGIPDTKDDCPSMYGIAANKGCPSTPTTPGTKDTDYDGIEDNKDSCPEEYGASKANGCPDKDNDGIPDKSDKCVDKAGTAQWQGCPDTDADGVPDHEDQCPDKKGPIADKGCPPADRDADGIPDVKDKCPTQKGESYLEGCPDKNNDPIYNAGKQFLEKNAYKPGVIVTSSGLQYEVMKQGTGKLSPAALDRVEVHYHGTLLDGTVFDSSVDRGQSATFALNQVIKGFSEGLQLMKEGDKFKLYIPPELAYEGRAPNGKIKPWSVLVFELELIKVERVSQSSYLEANGKLPGVYTTESGLQYEVLRHGTGKTHPDANDKVEVDYHGTLIDGRVFDSSVERKQSVTFGLNQVIAGWTEGLQLMVEGDKFRFVIPPKLAYGDRAAGKLIKPGDVLIFEVELHKIFPQ